VVVSAGRTSDRKWPSSPLRAAARAVGTSGPAPPNQSCHHAHTGSACARTAARAVEGTRSGSMRAPYSRHPFPGRWWEKREENASAMSITPVPRTQLFAVESGARRAGGWVRARQTEDGGAPGTGGPGRESRGSAWRCGAQRTKRRRVDERPSNRWACKRREGCHHSRCSLLSPQPPLRGHLGVLTPVAVKVRVRAIGREGIGLRPGPAGQVSFHR